MDWRAARKCSLVSSGGVVGSCSKAVPLGFGDSNFVQLSASDLLSSLSCMGVCLCSDDSSTEDHPMVFWRSPNVSMVNFLVFELYALISFHQMLFS